MPVAFRPPLVAVGIALASMTLLGCSHSGTSESAPSPEFPQASQPTNPVDKIVKHTFYGYDPQAPGQRELLEWTSHGGDGPIDGTYSIQEQDTGKSSWTDVREPTLFQGTQHGNEITVPAGQIDEYGTHGTLQQNGHRLHLDGDLGIETYDLYDSPSPP